MIINDNGGGDLVKKFLKNSIFFTRKLKYFPHKTIYFVQFRE